MGELGEALIRGVLGVIVILIGILFIVSGNKTEYPKVKKIDDFTGKLELPAPFWEESLNQVIHYNLKRAPLVLCLFGVTGLISGVFGLGAGWAIIPVLNMIMMAPLKVAATSSTVMISLGNTAAVWPYILGGGMFPLFAIPCMLGMILGAMIGSRVMFKIKTGFIRWIIIFVMFAAGIRLIIKTIEILT
jgi:uncharacterized protein